jgi:hypothetical protein
VKENTQQYGALASSDPQAYTPLQEYALLPCASQAVVRG